MTDSSSSSDSSCLEQVEFDDVFNLCLEQVSLSPLAPNYFPRERRQPQMPRDTEDLRRDVLVKAACEHLFVNRE